MALKDKLMTLEDFKAVRDVDVASNSAQFTEIKDDLGVQTGIISKTPGYYVNLTADPVDISNPSSSTTGLTYAVVDCSDGDKFVINAAGAALGRAWGFLDSSNHVLSMADQNVTVTDLELTAPTNAVKLVINDKGGGMSYKVGNNLATRIDTKAEDALTDEVKDAILACFSHVMMYGDTGVDYYSDLEEALYPTGKYAALQMSDVVSSRGITNFSVDALGNISYSEVAKFSVIEFSQDIKRIEFYQDTTDYPGGDRAWFIFRKVDDNTFYGTDGHKVFVFTWNSATGKYTATRDDTLATVTGSNIGTFVVPQRKTLSIKDGIATMKNEDGGSVSLTNANMIGIWEQNSIFTYKAVRVKR